MDTFLLTLTLVVGFYMLWNIGANDVANAIGTSVGSKALTLKKAIFLAAILEFLGAFLLGSNVSETIQSSIVSPTIFADDPMIYIIGMISALLSTAIWLQIATYFKWPVSTTHAIIGAIVGFGFLVGGSSAISWNVISTIALSWVLSPVLSGIAAYLLFLFLQKKILYSYNPVYAAKKIAPQLMFVVFFTFTLAIGANGLENVGIRISTPLLILLALLFGIISALLVRVHTNKIIANKEILPRRSNKHEEQLHYMNKAKNSLIKTHLGTSSTSMTKTVNLIIEDITSLIDKIKLDRNFQSDYSIEYQLIEKIFASLQIVTACFVAFGHGANDVANAIGPVSAVLQVIKDPTQMNIATHIPTWLLVFGGVGIVIGLATFGWRVIETIGKKITNLTPTRGFSAEFAAALTIIIASKMGLPISTTHAIVGAVLGVGFCRGIPSLNFKLIKEIFLSWIITLPCSAIVCIALYYVLQSAIRLF